MFRCLLSSGKKYHSISIEKKSASKIAIIFCISSYFYWSEISIGRYKKRVTARRRKEGEDKARLTNPYVGCTHCNGGRYLALPEGLEIAEVMRLASYSKYDTTLKYYPAVKDDLVDRARRVVRHRVSREMLEEEV